MEKMLEVLEAILAELRRFNDRQEGIIRLDPKPVKQEEKEEPKQCTIEFNRRDYSAPRVDAVAKIVSKKTGQPASIYRKDIRAKYRTFRKGKYEHISAEDANAYKSLFFKYNPRNYNAEN